LAVRLLAGEVLDLRDEHGRRWLATSAGLACLIAGQAVPVVDHVSAADVAIEITRRGLRRRRRSSGIAAASVRKIL
jgi:hypothetical protein